MGTKQRKAKALLLGLAVCLAMTGCANQTTSVTVNSDGSGTVFARGGLTEDAVAKYEETYGADVDTENMDSFMYRGERYYGYMAESSFASPATLDLSFVDDARNNVYGAASDIKVGFGDVSLSRQSDGSYKLDIKVDTEANLVKGLPSNVKSLYNSNKSGVSQMLTFSMPGDVKQTAGDTTGVTINGSVLSLDYAKLVKNKNTSYSFTIGAGRQQAVLTPSFTDVPSSFWAYNAIESMARGGLVSGYGNGIFGPTNTITIEQFCQILARATGMETGAGESGWWAEKAVASCVNAGYVAQRDGRAAYAAPITREAAIAGLQMASGRAALEGKNYTIASIPDAADISPQYKDLIVAAYNSGITNGVKADGTFLPQRTLTRAEVCQLFYNLSWTAPRA